MTRRIATRDVRRDDRGTVTAEVVIVTPAVIAVVMMCAAALTAAGTQIRLEHAAAQSARYAARAEDPSRVSEVASRLVEGVVVRISREGDLVCADLRARSLPTLPDLHARACAWEMPRG